MRSARIRAPHAVPLGAAVAAAGLLVLVLPGTALAGSATATTTPSASPSSPGQGIGPSPANGRLSQHCSVDQSAVRPGGELDFSLTVSQNTADPYQQVMGAIVTIYKSDDADPSALRGKGDSLRMRNPATGTWLSAEEIDGNVSIFDASGSSPWPYLPPYGSLTFEFRLTVAAGQSAGEYTIEPRAGGLATDYFIWAQQGYSSPQCGFRVGSSGGHSGGSGASGSNSGNGTASHTAPVHTTPSRTPSPTPSLSAAASTSADPSSPPSPAAVPTHSYQHPQLTSVADAHTAGAAMAATSGALAASAAATFACLALAGARFAGRRRPGGKR